MSVGKETEVAGKQQTKGKKWCGLTRDLLKSHVKVLPNKETDDSLLLARAITRVEQSMDLLENEAIAIKKKVIGKDETTIKDDPKYREYLRLSAAWEKLGEEGRVAVEKKSLELARTLTARLDHLNDEIQHALGNRTDEQMTQSSQALLVKEQQEYEKSLLTAKQQELDLNNRADGTHTFSTEVSKVIGNAQQLAAAKDYVGAMKKLTEVSAAYNSGLAKAREYQSYCEALSEANGYARELAMLNTSTSEGQESPVTKIISAARVDASTFKYVEATKKLGEAKDAYKNAVKNVDKYQQQYISKMVAAEVQLGDLAALKHDGMQYDDVLKEKITDAKKLASGGKFKEAVEGPLKNTSDVYSAWKKKAKLDREASLEKARHEPVYRDKVLRIEAAIIELESQPGTKTQVAKLKLLLANGENAVKSKAGYEAAYKALEGLSGTLEEGRKAALEFRRNAGDEQFRQSLATVEDLIGKLDKLCGKTEYAEVARLKSEVQQCLIRVDGGDVQAERINLNLLIGPLREQLESLTTAASECKSRRDEAHKLMTELQKIGNISKYDLLPLQRTADAMYALEDYIEAKNQYADLIEKAKTLKGKLESIFKQWQTLKNDADIELLLLAGGHPADTGSANALATKLRTAIEQLELTHDYDQVVKLANEAKVQGAELKTIRESFDALAEDRKNAETKISEAKNLFKEKIAALAQAGGDAQAFQAKLEELDWRWTSGRLKCLDKSSLQKLVDGIQEELTENRRVIELIMNNPGELKKSQNTVALAKAKKEFDQQVLEIKNQLNRMRADASAYEFMGPMIQTPTIPDPIIESVQSKLTDIINRKPAPTQDSPIGGTPADWNQLITDARQLLEATGEVNHKLDGLRVEQANLIRQRGEECLSKIKISKSKHKKYATFFTDTETRVKDYLAMADSPVCTTVETALNSLTNLLSGEIEPLEARFTQLQQHLERIKVNLADVDLKNMLPKRQESLQHRFDNDIEKQTLSLGPEKSISVLNNFENDVHTAVNAAKDAVQLREEIKRLVKECNDKLDLLEDAPQLKKSFASRIKSASTPLENGEITALQQLKSIRSLLGTVTSDTQEAVKVRAEMERSTREKELSAQTKLEEFKAARDVLVKNSIRDAKAKYDEIPGSKVNKELYEQIKSTLDDADKRFKDGILEVALEKLESTRGIALQFMANPYNSKTTARNQLAKVNMLWQKTAADFVKSINALKTKLSETAMEENRSQGSEVYNVQKLLEPLVEVARSFDPGRFEEYAKSVGEEATSIQQYRRDKEEALRFVRQYQSVLAKDPVLVHLENNPWQIPVSTKDLADRLNDLELNFRRA